MRLNIIVPCRYAADNLFRLVKSVKDQTHEDWRMYIAVDFDRGTADMAYAIALDDDRIEVVATETRLYALKNIINTIDHFRIQGPTGIIDGDDYLSRTDTFEMVVKEYEKGHQIVWTDMVSDDPYFESNNQQHPIGADPYTSPWVSSHFRTFDSTLLSYIDLRNFKDTEGNWFKRGYDQVLMLPLLHVCNNLGLSYKYIDEPCYMYRHTGSSTPKEEHTGGRLESSIVNFVRARGYVGSLDTFE